MLLATKEDRALKESIAECSADPSFELLAVCFLLDQEALLLRLFHEEGVVVDRVQPLSNTCSCSRDKVRSVLASFGTKEVEDMRSDEGNILVTCEFCAARYTFASDEIDASPGQSGD